MRFLFSSFIALATVALAVAQPPTGPLSLNPDPSITHPISDASIPSTEPLTNARRFAEGLPPLSPRAHRRTGVDSARRTVASPAPPVITKCNILVKDVNGTTFGFIKPVWNRHGEYGAIQPSQDGALEVSFPYTESTKPVSQLDFLATNGPNAKYPYVGAAVGFASPSQDFSVGSYSYSYIVGTTQTPPGGPPAAGNNNSFGGTTGIPKNAESAIWEYEAATQSIRPQWINTDGSAPFTELLYANDSNQAFIITGDANSLRTNFAAKYPSVTFTCVPSAQATPA